MAKLAHQLGIKVLYYISPTVWAWHKSRIHLIKKAITKMAVIFPFEKKFYEIKNVPVSYVGNPSLKQVVTTLPREKIFENLGLDPQKKVIGLLPGSRRGEIKNLLPPILEAVKLLKNKYPNLQFILPLANSLDPSDLAAYLQHFPHPITLVQHQTYNAISICEAVIATSGTVTLEAALLNVPMVIIYKVSIITYYIGRLLIDLHWIGLCNIIANKTIAKELIQNDANPKAIAAEIFHIVEDEKYRLNMKNELNTTKKLLLEGEMDNIGETVLALL